MALNGQWLNLMARQIHSIYASGRGRTMVRRIFVRGSAKRNSNVEKKPPEELRVQRATHVHVSCQPSFGHIHDDSRLLPSVLHSLVWRLLAREPRAQT